MARFVTTRSNVSYDMLPEFSESCPEAGQLERVQDCYVAWSQKDNFLKAILPDVLVDNGGHGGLTGETLVLNAYREMNPVTGNLAVTTSLRKQLLRFAPQKHPNVGHLYAMAATVEPLGYPVENGGILQVKQSGNIDGAARVRVTWKSLPFAVDVTDGIANASTGSEFLRWCSIKTSFAGQNLEVPGTRLELYDPITGIFLRQLPTGLRKTFAESHIMVKWHMVPLVPNAAHLMAGRVNLTAFNTPAASGATHQVFRQGFRRGTLLYLSYECSEPYTTIGGNRVFDICYHFLHRDNMNGWRAWGTGHNFLFSAIENAWVRAGIAANFVGGGGGLQFPIQDNPHDAGKNIADYMELTNLWKIDDNVITVA